jgi:hypothetical protein
MSRAPLRSTPGDRLAVLRGRRSDCPDQIGAAPTRVVAGSELEKLSALGEQLIFGWTIDDVIRNDSRGSVRPMFVDVVPEVDQRSFRTCHQHSVDGVETGADRGEELMLRANFGSVLRRRMSIQAIAWVVAAMMVVLTFQICDAFANSANGVIAWALCIDEGPRKLSSRLGKLRFSARPGNAFDVMVAGCPHGALDRLIGVK